MVEALAAVVALGASAVIVFLALRHVAALQRSVGDVARSSAGSVAELKSAFAETRAQVTTLQQALQAQLTAVQQNVTTQVGQTQSTLRDLREQLGGLQQQSREISDLAKDIGSLQDLLRPPKLRGELGQYFLERILEDVLPGRYERQYEFPTNRTRVDAVVRVGDKLVPIDSKFPYEQFVELASASPEERRARRRSFVATMKRHIDSVADNYIVPHDGTVDFALLYVPAEAIYYEISTADDMVDLRAYCQQRRVLPVSPNTLQAFLAAVHLGLRGMAIQDRAREIQKQLGQIAQDLAQLEEEHAKLGRHLDNARKVHETATRWIGRVGERLQHASATPIVERSEQTALPLGGDRDE